jgi:probable addiction module antidote protein
MTAAKTRQFDPAEYLDDNESIAAYMSESLETEDPAFIADALEVVARASSSRKFPSRAPASF